MTDLDTELRELLQRKASQAGGGGTGAPEPVLRRARRRQGLVAAVAALTVVAVAAGAFAAGRWIGRSDGTPGAPTTSETVKGVTITYPEDWFLATQTDVPGPVDPSDGLLFDLSNVDLTQGRIMACPPEAEDYQQIVAMSVQEYLGVAADPAAPSWPVEPVPFEPDPIASGPGCQPQGWSYLSAEWTVAGRTFFAALAFGAESSEADREALMIAYRSMTFEPLEGGTESVELVSGSTGDETWTLSVSVGADGEPEFTITRENFVTGESSGEGAAAAAPAPPVTGFLSRFGDGAKVTTVVYGIVPAETASVNVSLTGEDAQGNPMERGPEPAEVVDLPDAFRDVHAYYFVAGDPWTGAEVEAFDADGSSLGTASPDEPLEEPTAIPTTGESAPPVMPVVYSEHELLWGAYLATGNDQNDAQFFDETAAWLQDRGLPFASGEISCDQPTGDETIGDPGDDWRVATYFTSEEDAQAFVAWYFEERLPGADPMAIQIIEVGTYCSAASEEPPVEQVALEHGGTVWALYLLTWNGATGDPDEASDIAGWLESRGVTVAVGNVECDQGSEDIVLEPDHDSAVALYFATEQDANTFLEWYYGTRYPGADYEVLIGEVHTFCLD
jgi:hypothetical protein